MKSSFASKLFSNAVASKLNVLIIFVIIINAICIMMEESGIHLRCLQYVDNFCIVIFILEMIYKIIKESPSRYFSNVWDIFDFVIILVSIPSLLNLPNLSILLSLRMLRLIRFMKIIKIFNKEDIKKVYTGTLLGLRRTASVFIALLVLIFILGLLSCNIFSNIAPDLFGTPLLSIYSTFQLFTVEEWTNIAGAMSGMSPVAHAFAILYFVAIVFIFGILCMSLINSIFVDAMVEDNNDDVKAELEEMKKMLADLSKQLSEK